MVMAEDIAMNVEILADEKAVARRAAAVVAAAARDAVVANGRFALAVSGGRTPWLMLKALAGEKVPWEQVHLFQVDERIAPAGHADRNLTHLRDSLLSRVPLPPEQVYAMPVETADLDAAAAAYAETLRQVAGTPPVLDLVHLGLGPDGHTASLLPGDPALDATGDVAATGVYQGRRRLTLTFPTLERARAVLWIVTGADKAAMLARLLDGDATIPAGRVNRERASVLADRVASGAT